MRLWGADRGWTRILPHTLIDMSKTRGNKPGGITYTGGVHLALEVALSSLICYSGQSFALRDTYSIRALPEVN